MNRRSLFFNHSIYVVRLALNILNEYTNCDVENEVIYAYEFWQENEEIKAACEEYFNNNSVDYKTVLIEHQRALEEIKERALSDVNCAQGKLIGNWRQDFKIEDYMEVVQSYYQDYTKDEVEILLYELLDEGCGYAAVVATLIRFYKNKSYDFQKTFGFSMYDNYGNVNSDLLLLHFYCLTDCSDYGMSLGQLVRRFQRFMRKYSIKGKMKLLFKIDPDVINAKNKYFLVMTRNCVLIDEKRKKTYLEQWHYMNLNCIDNEGNYFVTSWGEKYMIRKADMGDKFYYVQITYED